MKRHKNPDGAGNLSRGYRRTMVNYEVKWDHIRVAERALGRAMPDGAIVHHVNEKRDDNRPSNLVICPNAAYHKLLHLRMKAVSAGHPAHWRKCRFCKTWDAPENLYIAYSGVHHRACCATYYREKRRTTNV